MLDDHFDEPVAADYDDDPDPRFGGEPLRLEVDFLAGLCGSGGRALELAIGTGRTALPLAARGVTVAGVDLSEAMVARLRAKPGGRDLEVVLGDVSTARVAGTFDLVYLLFNTIGNVTTQDGQVGVFQNAARHLRPGGCFVVECEVPGVLGAQHGSRFRVFSHTDDHHGVDEYDPSTQLMSSHHYTALPDGRYRRVSVPFRYAWPAELDLMARIAGLRLRERWAWWDRTPFDRDSPAHVSVWHRHT